MEGALACLKQEARAKRGKVARPAWAPNWAARSGQGSVHFLTVQQGRGRQEAGLSPREQRHLFRLGGLQHPRLEAGCLLEYELLQPLLG